MEEISSNPKVLGVSAWNSGKDKNDFGIKAFIWKFLCILTMEISTAVLIKYYRIKCFSCDAVFPKKFLVP